MIQGRDIRAARHDHHVSQSQLAKRLQLDRAVVIAIERERIVITKPTPSEIMAAVMQCRADSSPAGTAA